MKQNYLKSFCARCLTLLVLALMSTNLAWGENTWTRVTTIKELTDGGTFIMGYEATAKSGVIVPLRSTDCDAKTTANGHFYTGTTTGSSTNGTIDMSKVTETADYEVYITSPASGKINIQMKNDEGSFYGATSGGTTSNKGRLYTSGNSNETNLTPEFSSETDNQFKLTSDVTGQYKYLKYNTGSPRFAFYNSAGSNIVFYKKQESTKTLQNIAVKTAPTKTKYYTGDKFDPAGLVITASYDTGNPEDIAYTGNESKFTFSPTLDTELQTSNTSVVITYGGKTCNQTITVSTRPAFTVTLGDTKEELKESSAGAGVTLPSRTCVNPAYSFAGWSATNITEETETAPTIIPAGAYTPTADIELYPVFKRTVSSGEVTWDVVANASDLAAGDVIIMGLSTSNGTFAAGAKSADYLNAVSATIEKGILQSKDAVEFTLGKSNDNWTLTSTEGQLGATAAKKLNYDTSADNYVGTWTIAISNNNASITSTGSYGTIQFNYNNGTNPRFLNYTSSQTAIQIYKKNESSTTYYTSNPPTESLLDPVIAVAEGEYWGEMSVEITQSQSKEIYYTIDGSDPKEGILYEAPVSITESCTLKAVAKDGEDYSGVVTAEYIIHPTTANVPVSEDLKSAPEHWRQVGAWTFHSSYGACIEGTDEAWLISPQIIKEKDTYVISYESASQKGTADKLELYYSTDYDHSTNNYATATWTKIESCPNVSGGWTYKESTPTLTIDNNVTFAFKYTDNNKWEIKNFSVTEKYGTQAEGTASFASANIFVENTKTCNSPEVTTNNTEGVKTYASDNTDVATVDATTGEVTAVSEGVATITVTIAENANYTECSASYTVTVTPEGNLWYEDWTGTTSETVISTYNPRYTITGDTKVANNNYAGGVAPELLLNGTWTIDLSNDVLDGVYNLQYYSNGNPEISVVGGAVSKAEVTTIAGTAKKYVVPVVVSDYENFSIKFEIQSNTRLDNIALILDHETKSFAKTISNRKMATLYLDYAVEIPTGVKAYTAADKDDSHTAITLEKITDGVIPANTGVIVYADVETNTSFDFVETATTKTYDNNCLKGVIEKTVFNAVTDYDASTYNYYALMADGETSVVFKLVSGGSYAANSAYLVLPKTANAKVDFTFGDEVTGIESLTPALSEGKGVYNLQGVRVNNGYKGIVIMNGKKYINK